jgi:3-phosphoshikimate 1-carboxyvinyltransferase
MDIHAPSLDGPVDARCAVPGSKSITNRAMLLAALAPGASTLHRVLDSEDSAAFAAGLAALGYAIELDRQALVCRIGPGGGGPPRGEASVWVQNAGTAARFLLALCAAGEGEFRVDGTPQMRGRPVGPLVCALEALGAEVEPPAASHLPLRVRGRGIAGGTLREVGAQQSSQFVSALLMVAPMARAPLSIDLAGSVSRPFVEMTTRMMEQRGVAVRWHSDHEVYVPAPQTYASGDFTIEGDASTASYFAAAAALTGGTVTLSNVTRRGSLQGDIRFLDILETMGCEVVEDACEGVTVRGPAKLRGIDVDMADISDTFLTLACIAPFAAEPVRIRGIGHTRVQESDRIASACEGLTRMGVSVQSGLDWLEVHPSVPRPAQVRAHDDHRVAMAFAVTALRTPGTEILGAHCVEKTCPDFFERWKRMCDASRGAGVTANACHAT